MSERTLLIRVDGGRSVGLGHLMRCLALCRALDKKGVDTVLLMRERQELQTLLAAEMRMVVALPPEGSEADAARMAREIRATLGGDALLVDLPVDLEEDEFDAFSAVGLPLVMFDDHGPAASKADVVINAIAHPDLLEEPRRQEGLYRGAEYIILDPAYSNAGAASFNPKVRKILVAMGGSDPHGITPRALRALMPLSAEFELHALVGPASAGAEQLRRDIDESADRVVIHEGVDNLPGFLPGFDIAVISFGLTAYGAAALGLPAVHIGHDSDGAAAAEAFARLYGCSVALGRHDQISEADIVSTVKELIGNAARREEMAARGRAAVDGRGLERVVELVLGLVR